MTKQNKVPLKPKSTIQISRNRGGGKKRPDLFANLRNVEHPLDGMFPPIADLPTVVPGNLTVDPTRPNELNPEIRTMEIPGAIIPHSLDIQTQQSLDIHNEKGMDIQSVEVLDSQKTEGTDIQPTNTMDIQAPQPRISNNNEHGYPNTSTSDIRLNKVRDIQDHNNWIFNTETTGYPEGHNMDIHSDIIGYPTDTDKDILISKNEKRISNKQKSLDIQISKEPSPDIQTDPKKANWKKYEPQRRAKGVFLRTNDDLTVRFKQFCIGKGWDFSYGTELAWNKLMSDLDIQTSGDLDSLIALDNRRLTMMFKSKPFIINLYLAYNSIFNEISDRTTKGKWAARWSPRDDEAAVRYNEIHPNIVELGIIQTQMNKGFGQSKIQTFKYYIDEIEKVLSSGVTDELLGTILGYHRTVWKNTTKREVDLSFLDKSE